jgi:hypothetical protein
MARKITAGEVGGSSVGGLNVTNSTLSAVANTDIVLDPQGTGQVSVDGNVIIEDQGLLKFGDSDNSNYVALRAPATVATDVTWTLPATDGTANQAITTNASGVLSFTTVQPSLTNNTVDSADNYVVFNSANSGAMTAPRASTALLFKPSTGTVSATAAVFSGTVNSLLVEVAYVASMTLALTDRDKVVTMNSASATTITIPTNATVAFPIGSIINLYRIGAGTVQVVPTGGVTLYRLPSLSGSAYMEQFEYVSIRKTATDTWHFTAEIYRELTATGGNTIARVANARYNSFTSGSSNLVVGAP